MTPASRDEAVLAAAIDGTLLPAVELAWNSERYDDYGGHHSIKFVHCGRPYSVDAFEALLAILRVK